MDDLTGKVALVTGASRGIGREIALALAAAGATIAVGYHKSAEDAEAVAALIVARDGKAETFGADLSDAEQAGGLVRDVEARLGPIGVLVNNAGINPSKPIDAITPADWLETIHANLSSAFYVTQAALPGLRARRWGRIIILSSIAAQTGGVIGPHYAASKAGLIGLMHSYANVLAKEGVTANAIAPALVETDMIKGNSAITPDRIPIGRFGKPDEIAAIAVMLATNGYITGQTINANGGWYMS
jgi:3-oxoacyl-[acyl-carrier protein] reductase